VRSVLLFVLALAGALAVSAQSGRTDRPLKVGASVSRSGSLNGAGAMYEKGLKLWAREVNERGGILGRTVELVLHDDASTPSTAHDIYQALLNDSGADVLFGPVDTQLAQGMLPVLERWQTPCLFSMPASDALWRSGKGLAFSVLAPLSEWPMGFFEMVARAGCERVALVAVEHPQAKPLRANTEKWAKRYGLSLTSEVLASPQDIPKALEQARRDKADVLTIWGVQDGCVQSMRAMKQMNWKPKAVFVSTSMYQHALRELPARDMEGVFTVVSWDPRMAKSFPGGSEFVAAFREAFAQDPETPAASGYASGQVLEAALIKAGTHRKDALRQALANLDCVTILGRYGVDAGGKQLRQVPLTEQWQKGKREIVWPEEMRTARPILQR
jgi:branched-chain amino acid transport system substrate-binding protein